MARGSGKSDSGPARSRGEATCSPRPSTEECRAALDALDTFVRRYHESEHGASGYPIAKCPFGVCDKLSAGLATISRTLEGAHDRERYLRSKLAHADVALGEPPIGNTEAVPVKAAEATATYRNAARTLFIRGHGHSDTTITALDLIEGELVRTVDICIRAVDALASVAAAATALPHQRSISPR